MIIVMKPMIIKMKAIIIVRENDISHPYSECHPKYFSPKLLGVVVFPTGIENGCQHKEKQHLADTPYHPFGGQGMTLENQTNGNKGDKVKTYAER